MNPYPLPSDARNLVPKAWGLEEILINLPEYCAKFLWVNEGWRSSLHYHDHKTESFWCLSGKVELEYRTPNTPSIIVILDGDRRDGFHIPHGTVHRFRSMTPISLLLEVSTTHSDQDVTRLEVSERDESTLGTYDHDPYS